MSLMTIPVISTCHLHEETNAWFTRTPPPDVAAYKFGFFVYVGEAHSPLPPYNRADLKALFDWMHTTHPDLAWVRLDADGEVIDGLPTYDW